MPHQSTHPYLDRRTLLRVGVGVAALGGLEVVAPSIARATELSERIAEQERVSRQVVTLRLELEADADAYHKAIEEHENAQLEVEKAQARIDANTKDIEALQEKLAERVVAQYRSDDLGVYDVLMNSRDFEEFATRWAMIERLNSADSASVSKIKKLREENEAEKAELKSLEEIAHEKMLEAQRIEAESKDKVAEAEALLDQITQETEEMIRRDQEAALAGSTAKVNIIGNPRGLEPTPEVVAVARSCMGIPYVWGGKSPNVFDCSGLVAWCYAQCGINIPSYTESEYALALAIGAVLPLSEVEPGDVLYRPGHVGIAAHKGGVPYIHAPHTGAVVRDTDSLAYSRFVCGLRFPRGISVTYIADDASDYEGTVSDSGLSSSLGASVGAAAGFAAGATASDSLILPDGSY